MGACPSATARLSPGLHCDRGKERSHRMGAIGEGRRHRRSLATATIGNCIYYLEDPYALHSLSKTGQTGARGTRSTYERKSLPNDRGASARLTRGPECTALTSGRLELRSLSFLAQHRAAKETGIRKNMLTQWGKSLEMRLSDAGLRRRKTKAI